MTFPSQGPSTQTTGNVAGGPYGAWSGTNTTALIGPAGSLVSLGQGGGGVALYDGANSITSGTAQFSNANGVTFGINGQTITASANAGGVVLNAGANSISTGTAVFSNANGVTFGIVGQTITASVPAVGGAQTGISGIVVSNTTYTSGTVSFSNANGLSFGSSAGQAITASYTVPATAGLISALAVSGGAGNSNTVTGMTFQNSNGLTFGVSTGASAASITGSYTVPATAGLISGLNVSGGAGNSQSAVSGITFNNSNGLTFGVSTGANVVTVTGSYTVPNVPALSIGVSNIGNTLGNTGIYSGQAVFGGVNVTLSVSSAAGGAQTITISGPTQSVQTLGIYASSNTTGATSSSNIDARSFTHVGQGIISVGISAGSLLFSATTAQTNQTIGLYALSQTTGGASSTTLDARTVSINPYGAMSAGFSAGSIQLSVPATSSLVGSNGISVSTNGSTITVSGVPQSVYIVGNTTGQSSSSYYTLGALTITAGAGISIGWSNGSLLFSA